MRLVGLIAGLTLALLAEPPGPIARPERAQPRLRRHRRRALAARRAPGARSGCSPPPSTTASSPIPIRSGWAARSTGTASCAPTGGRISSRPGAPSPTPTAAFPAIPTARPAPPPRPTAFSGAPATTTLLSFVGREGYRDPACDFAGRAVRHHDAARQPRPAPERLRPALRHLDRGARPAQVPQSAVRSPPPGTGSAAGHGYAAFLSNDPASPDSRAQPALGRLDRAAVPRRHGLRRLPHRLRPAEAARRPQRIRPGRTSTRWSATSTAASPTCSAAASRRTAWSGS